MERKVKATLSLLHIFYIFCKGANMPKEKIYKHESDFQADLIKTIKKDLGEDNLDILKNDANYKQGIPDLIISVIFSCSVYLKICQFFDLSKEYIFYFIDFFSYSLFHLFLLYYLLFPPPCFL